MIKCILCITVILLLIVDVLIFIDLKKYIKKHENELVEKNIKGLMGRSIGMTIISLCVGIIGILLQVI